jgi:hypothetical protein
VMTAIKTYRFLLWFRCHLRLKVSERNGRRNHARLWSSMPMLASPYGMKH